MLFTEEMSGNVLCRGECRVLNGFWEIVNWGREVTSGTTAAVLRPGFLKSRYFPESGHWPCSVDP